MRYLTRIIRVTQEGSPDQKVASVLAARVAQQWADQVGGADGGPYVLR